MASLRDPQHRAQRRPKTSPGSPAGTLPVTPDAKPPRIVARTYGPGSFEERVLASPDELSSLRAADRCLWVDITGLADASAIAAIGEAFDLHELSLEDVLDPAHRPKVEEYDDYTFIVLKNLLTTEPVEAHPLSLFVGDDFLLTLEDVESPALEPVRDRLRRGRGKIRSRGVDFLAYALIDSVIDHYFPVVEASDDRLESIEEAVLEARTVDPIDLARSARQDLQTIRRTVWPAREVVTTLLREDATRISDDTRVHLRDCYDHLVQLQELLDAAREIAANLLEAYISRVSLRTNEVMRVLTVIATVFIPLTFLTGLYGMNFNPRTSPLNMPELNWYWGYPFSLALMLVAAAASLLYFKKKGWFG